MTNTLLYISNGLIVISYVCYVLLVIINKKKKITNSNGFDITKDIISEYDSINIVLNKGIFTYYNIKRKVIKISNDCYYGNTISSISIPLIEAGISIISDKNNKYIGVCKKIIGALKYLYILPLIAIIINFITFGVSDAKIGIIIIVLFTCISYMFINIKCEACEWVSNSLNNINDVTKNNKNAIRNFINKIILFDKFIFFGELLIIIRFIAIIINFNI